MAELILKEECYKIIGLCMKVHTKLGRGFKEVIYKDALELELIAAGIPHEREKNLRFNLKNQHCREGSEWIFTSIIQ
jgi:GxxExxY protein